MEQGIPSVMAPENEPRSNPHEEVTRALTEYCHFSHNQGFAVMLNGAWGSGKTQFIKNCAKSLVRERAEEAPLKPLYVSLYGVSHTGEIDELLFQQLHPILSHKATRLAGAVLRSIGKFAVKVDLGHLAQLTGTVPEVNLTSLLAGAEGRVVIFDDFERALMPPAAILGYINPLVEHEDCKVIIVVDESQIDDEHKVDYNKRKEKTVGQTFKFDPDADSVYISFLKEIDDEEARAFLQQTGNIILQVFADSQLNNLRLLKQLLWDFERIWKILTPEQRAHDVAMPELLTLLCAAALELRSGRLGENDLQFGSVPFKMEPTSDPMQEIRKRYPTVRFDSTLLHPDAIRDCVLRSRVSKGRVQEQLKRHPYFAKPQGDMPSWQALWHGVEAPPESQDELVHRFETDFDARSFDDRGAVYHVIGLSLWLAHLGYPNWLDAEIENKVMRYINEVYSRRDASFEEASERERPNLRMGAYGLCFHRIDDPRFGLLVCYENEQRTAWRKRTYPAIAEHLQRLVKTDSQQFLRDVCFTNAGPSKFAAIGVLNLIPADQFAAAIAGAPYRDQEQIIMALSIRYDQSLAYAELKDELPWLFEVKSYLDEATTKLPRIAQEALRNLTRDYVDPITEKFDQNTQPLK